MEHLDEPYLNAKGYYKAEDGKEHCVFFMIGPKFGAVSKHTVNKESAILSPIYRERYRFLRCTSASWQPPISR